MLAARCRVMDGSWRSVAAQLGGFGASAKQTIGRGMMAKQISEIFEKARAGFKDK